MLACDPRWCHDYLEQGWFANDPWLKHATEFGTPVRGTDIEVKTPAERAVVDLAERYGFRSVMIVPAPSSGGMSRLGVLCLGSNTPGYFEGAGYEAVKVMARTLAMELHEWWLARIGQQVIDDCGLTPEDLALLGYEWHGLGSKEIAVLLHATQGSIDSRFQRLNAKLDVPNRKAAARLAAEYGLFTHS